MTKQGERSQYIRKHKSQARQRLTPTGDHNSLNEEKLEKMQTSRKRADKEVRKKGEAKNEGNM